MCFELGAARVFGDAPKEANGRGRPGHREILRPMEGEFVCLMHHRLDFLTCTFKTQMILSYFAEETVLESIGHSVAVDVADVSRVAQRDAVSARDQSAIEKDVPRLAGECARRR